MTAIATIARSAAQSSRVRSLRLQYHDPVARKLLPIAGILVLLTILLSPVTLSAFAGLGGYISEKLLGDSATTDSVMTLGDSTSGPVVLGSVPRISTMQIANTDLTSTTLRGTVTSMNGMPTADVWFVWGDSPATMTNTTPAVTIAAAGAQTATISGYGPGTSPIYYQFRSSSDGVNTGASILSFAVIGGRSTGYHLLWNVLTLIIGAGILLVIIRMAMTTGNWVVALALTVIGIVAIYFVREVLLSFW